MTEPKQIVEGTTFISANDIKVMEPGNTYSLKWSNGSSLITERYQDHAMLRYAVAGEPVEEYIGLDHTKTGYGMRTWLLCPSCGERTAKVYNVKGTFACRVCNNLTYLTSKSSGNRLRYLGLKIRRLQIKLGMDTTDIHEKPTFKPKHMHQQTFWVLRTQLEIAQLHFVDEWLKLTRR
ncbi:hypothetical protein SAMN04488134_102135 [Amphibacillus marinus]|uniref:Transposase zinc-ribbon domain-containing protein n=1 Tax=Amphibacillus marinus TaxID=872970 RepID=A0A1H8K1N8_9BACI|nr:hypothetical protein [Amphibacillus marinus]SEN86691.1 hypothetical protein SAMN04488134_102135 [Amphibacillus marinus]